MLQGKFNSMRIRFWHAAAERLARCHVAFQLYFPVSIHAAIASQIIGSNCGFVDFPSSAFRYAGRSDL
jgi:hypothetical protein